MSNEVSRLEGEKVSNPYAMATEAAKSQGPGTSIAQTDSSRAMIEVMTQYEVAKRFPRDMILVSDRIIKECTRPTLAELSTYEYPRGKETITGPTIRLLECIARALGNINFGWQVIESSKAKSTIRAFAIDMESNMRSDKQFDVLHWRSTKSGGYALTDDRDIYELQANQAARRVRSCIEALVPRDVIDMALEQCEMTNKRSIDTSAEGIKKLLDWFATYGVNKAMIEALFNGLKIEAFKAPQLLSLRKKAAALRDGIATVADFFDTSLADKIETLEKKSETADQPDLTKVVEEKKSETPKKEEPAKTEEKKSEVKRAPIFDEISKAIQNAKTLDELKNVWDVEYEVNLKALEKETGTGYADLMNLAVARREQISSGKLV